VPSYRKTEMRIRGQILKVSDVVRINCRTSKYNGVEGEVFHILKESQYAVGSDLHFSASSAPLR
jgi:hypothetical protein